MVRLMRYHYMVKRWYEVIYHGVGKESSHRYLCTVEWNQILGKFVWFGYKRVDEEGPLAFTLWHTREEALESMRKWVGEVRT